MKNGLIILALKLLFTAVLSGQNSINIEDFSFLQGNWTGVLEYTDYQDDKTKVELKTFSTYYILDKKLLSHTTYIEPNGEAVYNEGQISVSKKGDKVRFFSELMSVSEKSDNRLVLTSIGEDNDKKAQIRETIEWTNVSITITKEVKYDGSDVFLKRHQYRFQPETAEETQKRLLNTALGTWELDLRPEPAAQPYAKDFVLSACEAGDLKGVFYGTPFDNGKINTAWGKLYFSFTTADQSNTYYHSGYVSSGKVYGSSYSSSRNFMLPWFGTSKKSPQQDPSKH